MEHEIGDATGPGTEAWEQAEAAIRHGINGRLAERDAAIDAMTRAMIVAGRSVDAIRHNETFIAERIASPEPDDYDDDVWEGLAPERREELMKM